MSETKKRYVVYTAIFGKKDHLHEPRQSLRNFDLICFTDQDLTSTHWQVRKVPAPLADPTRSARMYKILAHKFLPEYDVSIWVDGNIRIHGDLGEMIEKYLAQTDLAVFDRSLWHVQPVVSTLRGELNVLLESEKVGKPKDDSAIMKQQVEAYFRDGYPDTSGMVWTCTLLRRHNKADVVAVMEEWWKQLTIWSKRDQLSFNYVAWKLNFPFTYIPLDASQNPYTQRKSHYLPLSRRILARLRGLSSRFTKMHNMSTP